MSSLHNYHIINSTVLVVLTKCDIFNWLQLTFDTFTVGKFVSFTSEGCPDGHMSIRETERPDTEGQWCGSAWGYTVYYSEGRSLNLTLLLDKLSEQVRLEQMLGLAKTSRFLGHTLFIRKM